MIATETTDEDESREVSNLEVLVSGVIADLGSGLHLEKGIEDVHTLVLGTMGEDINREDLQQVAVAITVTNRGREVEQHIEVPLGIDIQFERKVAVQVLWLARTTV
uniref:Uncharacterized protein n=1 Tax=Photinus pyralis TaxID=7054 RepID=A0A1Y1JZD7_PHOPY